jgi:acyl-CoA thioester hydrolase
VQTIYTCPIRVRSYECDANGHVNNAVYQQYLEEAATLASGALGFPMEWYAARGETWFLRRLSLVYHLPARAHDELTVTTWISSRARVRSLRQYEVKRVTDGATIVQGCAEWAYVNLSTGRPCPIPTELDSRCLNETPPVVPDYPLPAASVGTRVFRWRHVVRRYELDTNRHVNNAVYLNWLEEAKIQACAGAGWTLDQMAAENLLILQTRHDTEYLAPARHGDEIEVVSQFHDLRKVRGTWRHEVRRVGDGTLIARNFSTGAFLTLDGRPTRAPERFTRDIIGADSGHPPGAGPD